MITEEFFETYNEAVKHRKQGETTFYEFALVYYNVIKIKLK